ncbi:DMT family transporter [Aquabacterium sp. OR-4]|uniref:DMT family transporter n=1 Tax=Aquabacterium sp. OR-4 TaxID=2978127 RepID=UPI0021B34424|nr:DMT family transporter [Aquabacterium sp. OR-4]MDT7835753.1 DMT family transporter [Aquabacterium sp. OR-4]
MPSATPAAPAAASAPRPWLGPLLAIAGAMAFSGKAIIVKLGYRHSLLDSGVPLDALTLVMLRMLVALPFFVLLAWWGGRGRAALGRHELAAVAALGFAGYYLSSTLDFLGLQYISASLERLILYITPTVVVLLSQWLFGRRATRAQWLAMALAYVGLLLVFGRELHFEGPRAALGAALVLASTLSYALYMIYSGEWVRRIGALRLAGWASAVACVLCLLQFVALRPLATLAAVPAPVWWLSLLNGTLCTVAPVLMVMMAIERIGSSRASQLGMVGPVSTILMGVVLLGEPLTGWLVAGTLCVLGSVTWLARIK